MIRRYIIPLFRSIYTALILLAFALSACVWFFAPFIGSDTWRPFDTVASRLITIGVIWGLTLFVLLVIALVRARRDRKMTEEMVETVDAAEDDVIGEELVELRGKFKTALAELRKSKNGRKHLNDLPWYIMIGPPGAGKTTAIVNSGLQFPLAEKLGSAAIGGVGGTRNCDWWFTNKAVLIDTAGRYTTQESDAEADNAAWLGFLGLLKKYRKRQPINGAVIAISLSDLSMQDEMTQKSHATAIRNRLAELREKLGVRFPVYVVFTKADLIAGFQEYYDTLGKEEREQVWGFTMPVPKGKTEQDAITQFDEEFAGLLGQLNAQLLEKMQNETDPQRRALVAGFPAQVASVRGVAREFLKEVFQDNAYQKNQLLRGVYFASGTQEGTPIDRLMLGMAQTFGIGRQAIGTGRGSGRSYFLTRLFEGVMFPEAGLVSADDRVERRYRWGRRIAITATVLLALVMGAVWVNSFLRNKALIAEASSEVDQYQSAADSLPPSPVGDADLVPVAAALNLLRDLPGNPLVVDPREPELAETWGLYQGEVIGNQAAQTYRSALNRRLLPRLLVRLEEQIAQNMNDVDQLYEALKIYLMLGLQGPMNPDLVKEFVTRDWEEVTYSGVIRQDLRQDLAAHLDVLLSQPMQEIALNGDLIAQARGVLAEMPMAQRVYSGIINSRAATELPQFRLTDIGGPEITRVMTRSSGKPMAEGIPGVFSYSGFNDFFLTEAVNVARRVQSEAWVLGDDGEQAQSEAAQLALSRDVLDLYYNDFIGQYDDLLGDLDVIPLQSLNQAVNVTRILSGASSPLENVLKAVEAETQLTQSRNLVDTTELNQGLNQVANVEARANLSIQAQILLEALMKTGPAQNGQQQLPPGKFVEQRYSWLHDLVDAPDGQPSQLDGLMGLLLTVYQELNKMTISGISSGGASSQALTQFQQEAARFEGPLQRWAKQITVGSSGITSEGTRASINATWQSEVLPFCTQAIDNRYPFNRSAPADVAMADFAKLFSPGGLIDGFFANNLAQYVDTGTNPWSFKPQGSELGISQSVLTQMQNAAEIRDAFFANGATPSVPFQITPKALDPKAKEMILEIDGTTVEFNHRMGQPTPVAVVWPGSVGLARITLNPQRRDSENVLSKDGPWAWFRLLDAAEVRRTNAVDRRRVNFTVGGRLALYELQAGSAVNPFALPAMAKFSCPKSM